MNMVSAPIIDAELSKLPAPMRAFLQAVPKQWNPRETELITYFAFDGQGMSVLVFDLPPGDGDAQMDFVVQNVIRYRDQYHPKGLIGVSEGYGWSIDPEYPREQDRSQKFRAARKHMPGKQEQLMAFVETETEHLFITWPIYPGARGGTRWLGPRTVHDATHMMGRFSYLLQRAHAGETLVKAVGKPVLPLTPRSTEELRARFPAAVKDVHPLGAHEEPETHTFDFEDGLRLGLSIHQLPDRRLLLVIAINLGRPIPAHRFDAFVLQHLSDVSGEAWTTADILERSDTMLRQGVLSFGMRLPRNVRCSDMNNANLDGPDAQEPH
jgi:hypothetical protein